VKEMRNDSTVRLITVTVLGILGLWFISTLLFGSGMGLGFGVSGNYGGGHMGYGYGYGMNSGSTFAYLLLLLSKVLFAVFIVALVAGIIVWVKNNIFTSEDIETIKRTFKGNNTENQLEKCSACGKTIEAGWKLCPHCGKEKIV
jgi:hypothetical protein